MTVPAKWTLDHLFRRALVRRVLLIGLLMSNGVGCGGD